MVNLAENFPKLIIVIVALLAAFMAASCASQKIIVKPPEDEISDIQVMINQLGLKEWRGHLADAKEKIIDQLTRTQYGLKAGNITAEQGAGIIVKAQEAIDKTDDMATSFASHSHGSGGGGYGGGSQSGSNGFGGNGSGDNLGGSGGGYGGGRHHRNSQNSDSSDSDSQSDRFKYIVELKDMVDSYYKPVTATATGATTTAYAVTATAADATITANTK